MSRLKEILTQLGFYKQGDFYCSRTSGHYSVIHESHVDIMEKYLENKMFVQGSSLVYHPPVDP
jgi:hypothetical protein